MEREPDLIGALALFVSAYVSDDLCDSGEWWRLAGEWGGVTEDAREASVVEGDTVSCGGCMRDACARAVKRTRLSAF